MLDLNSERVREVVRKVYTQEEQHDLDSYLISYVDSEKEWDDDWYEIELIVSVLDKDGYLKYYKYTGYDSSYEPFNLSDDKAVEVKPYEVTVIEFREV